MNAPKTAWLLDALANVQTELQMTSLDAQSVRGRTPGSSSCDTHPWVTLLRAWLPDRYAITQGYVIDSHGEKSDRLDAIVFERSTTPVLSHGAHHRLVPVESTAAVVLPCARMDEADIVRAARTSATVKRLRRAWARYPAASLRAPIPSIVVAVVALHNDAALASFEAIPRRTDLSEHEQIDCGVIPGSAAFDTFDRRANLVRHEAALSYFLFRLLSKLQSNAGLAGPDWDAYAQVVSGTTVEAHESWQPSNDDYATPC